MMRSTTDRISSLLVLSLSAGERRADQDHFADDFHKKLAEIIIGKLRMLNPV